MSIGNVGIDQQVQKMGAIAALPYNKSVKL
jgi:hypothetical protein